MFGHGSFIYQPDYTIQKHGSAANAASALVEMGMSHAWIRGHNKNGLWKESANKKLIDAFRAKGISVGVWGWCDGNDVEKDIQNSKQAVRTFAPDCYIADIENKVSGANWDSAKAAKYGKEMRSYLGDMPLVVSSFGYISWHKPEIMSALDPYADYFAPQVYWFWYPNNKMLNETPISGLKTKNPADYTKVCIHHWKKAVTKPLIVTGQAYWGEHASWTQSVSEKKLAAFLAEFDGYTELAGFNWWNFADSRAMSSNMAQLIAEADIDKKMRLTADADGSSNPSNAEYSNQLNVAPAAAISDTRWIAAEGLHFREAPDGSDDDNIIASLEFGDKALINGTATINGYVNCIVSVDGVQTNGYLFEQYLRPNEAPMVERAIQEAVGEWLRFDRGNGVEYLSPYNGYINEMWTARGYPNLTGNDRDWFWSAAYISWILENAGYENTTFDIRHSTYIHEAIQNRVLQRAGDFWAYRLDEAEPQVGDIVCQWRETETTYDEAETKSRFSSHTDIIIAVRERAVITLGGNVANATSGGYGVSVETKTYRRDSNGLLRDERKLFAIMKNQFRPHTQQLLRV